MSRYMTAMAKLQTRVRRYPTLVQSIRTVRNLVHFGPWRRPALTLRRHLGSYRAPCERRPRAVSGPLDVHVVADALETAGYFSGPRIKAKLIREAESFWRDKGPGIYVDVHREAEPLACIAGDPEILDVAGTYFGCEPTLVECKLFVSRVGHVDALSSAFHFDHAGLRSLNVLVYLTAVDTDAGPHVLVAGTHRGKRWRDYLREYAPIDEIERRFPGRVHAILGPAGTLLFENAEVFHRRLVARRRRVAMIMVFSTRRRRLLSEGRDLRPSRAPTAARKKD